MFKLMQQLSHFQKPSPFTTKRGHNKAEAVETVAKKMLPLLFLEY